MKVKELIAKLQKMDQDATVVVSEMYEIPILGEVGCDFDFRDVKVADVYVQYDGTVKIDV